MLTCNIFVIGVHRDNGSPAIIAGVTSSREAYGRQWVEDHAAKADSPTTESFVIIHNESVAPTRAWTWLTTDSTSSTSDSSDLQTEISHALACQSRAELKRPDHVACALMDGLSKVFRMAMQPHFHESIIDLIINDLAGRKIWGCLCLCDNRFHHFLTDTLLFCVHICFV